MDEVEFHREPPSNVPTLVVAFGGWVDAGDAATSAMRYLVRVLAATPLASIDPEDFCDFTQLRPVVRLTAAGERTIRWPRCAFWTWQHIPLIECDQQRTYQPGCQEGLPHHAGLADAPEACQENLPEGWWSLGSHRRSSRV